MRIQQADNDLAGLAVELFDPNQIPLSTLERPELLHAREVYKREIRDARSALYTLWIARRVVGITLAGLYFGISVLPAFALAVWLDLPTGTPWPVLLMGFVATACFLLLHKPFTSLPLVQWVDDTEADEELVAAQIRAWKVTLKFIKKRLAEEEDGS